MRIMIHDWRSLTDLTRGHPFIIERVRLADDSAAIEGRFSPPALAELSDDDQAFVMAFIHAHGSLKQMEDWFGISYPTVKNRLRRIAEALPMIEHLPAQASSGDDPLDRLERGEIDAAQATTLLREHARCRRAD